MTIVVTALTIVAVVGPWMDLRRGDAAISSMVP
jgi:hypothetical protein